MTFLAVSKTEKYLMEIYQDFKRGFCFLMSQTHQNYLCRLHQIPLQSVKKIFL
jgi:hypothetical protein